MFELFWIPLWSNETLSSSSYLAYLALISGLSFLNSLVMSLFLPWSVSSISGSTILKEVSSFFTFGNALNKEFSYPLGLSTLSSRFYLCLWGLTSNYGFNLASEPHLFPSMGMSSPFLTVALIQLLPSSFIAVASNFNTVGMGYVGNRIRFFVYCIRAKYCIAAN